MAAGRPVSRALAHHAWCPLDRTPSSSRPRRSSRRRRPDGATRHRSRYRRLARATAQESSVRGQPRPSAGGRQPSAARIVALTKARPAAVYNRATLALVSRRVVITELVFPCPNDLLLRLSSITSPCRRGVSTSGQG